MDTEKIIKERQNELMDYLRFADRICRKNHIRYNLSFGSLLGAVRHKGFIPWDDDLDLSFEREEFYKFKKAVEKEADRTFTLIKELWIHRLVSREYGNEQNPKMLDCFIYDTVPAGTLTRKTKIFLLRCLQGMLKKKPNYKKYRGVQKILVFFSYQLGRLFPYELKFEWYQKIAQMGNKTQSHYVNIFDDDYSGLSHQIPIEAVAEWKDITFETEQFMSPVNADAVLKVIYGDYMTLPPVEKRIPMHLI